MSAYGSLPPVTHPKPILAPRLYEVRRKDRNESQITTNSSEWTHISVHHLTLARAPPALVGLMHEEFGAELERDETRTYPQEAGMTRADFESYYFARDVFVGIGHAFDSYSQSQLQSRLEEYNNNQSDDKYIKEENKEVDKDGLEGNNAVIMDLLESARAGRDWKDAIAGFYYICNAGFVISFSRRGLGLGYILGQSYLHYAPALGYRGSVFNLVYADNPGSLKIWDTLGFQRIGIVPGAGKRVRKVQKGDNGEFEEEVYYVDANIIYKSFV